MVNTRAEVDGDGQVRGPLLDSRQYEAVQHWTYTASANLSTKVLDFVQLGGPNWTRTAHAVLLKDDGQHSHGGPYTPALGLVGSSLLC